MSKTRITSLRPSVAMLAPQPIAGLATSWQDDRHGSRHERGYGTAWDKLRLRVLKRDQYICRCAECKRLDRLRPATHVDHIKCKALWKIERGSLEGVDADANLSAINKDCHVRKTAEDRKAVYAAVGRRGGGSPGNSASSSGPAAHSFAESAATYGSRQGRSGRNGGNQSGGEIKEG